MINKKFFILFLVFSLQLLVAGSQDNPFVNNVQPKKSVPAICYPGFIQSFLAFITQAQRELNTRLGELSRSLKEQHNMSVFFLLILISLLYGVIHAIGPGHGKVIMISYALANPLKSVHALWLAGFTAIIHTLSAICLVTVIYFILHVTFLNSVSHSKKIISLISYGLISLLGIYILIKTIREITKIGGKKKDPLHNDSFKLQKLIYTSLAIGLVPCEGAILLLTFSLSLGIFWLGIALSLVMSVGMAVTIALAGFIAIHSKKGVLKLSAQNKNFARTLGRAFQLTGALVITLFGILLFFANI